MTLSPTLMVILDMTISGSEGKVKELSMSNSESFLKVRMNSIYAIESVTVPLTCNFLSGIPKLISFTTVDREDAFKGAQNILVKAYYSFFIF